MNKLKLIFSQSLMITTGMLFGLGVQALYMHFAFGLEELAWDWYTPLSMVLTGLICAVPSTLVADFEGRKKPVSFIGLILHFLSILIIVSMCGYFFHWYDTVTEYLVIAAMYVVIYFFVWAVSLWLTRNEATKINAALKDIRDEE